MLTYKFMQIAFVVAILLGISIPLVGSSAVFKRLSSSGDALAHSSLAGVAIGLAAGLNPLLISIITCIVSFFIIELLRKKFNKYSEVGVAVVLSAAIGIAGILSSFTSASNFDSYLFGSILLISDTELYITIGLTVVIVLFSVIFYPQIFATLYSVNESKVSGIKVNLLTFVQDLLLSITIAIGAKIVGSLVVSSLVVLPTAIALQMKKGYKFTMIASVLFSVGAMISGLVIAYYANLKPGATIVTVSVALLLLMIIYRGILTMINNHKIKQSEKIKSQE
ncbi:MAG: metal ABC transporter permease [Bacilli bacterium]|nr:metal ABC transporter permease [Bacilli bacterium]